MNQILVKYNQLSTPQKLDFFEIKFEVETEEYEEKLIGSFLKSVVLDSNEYSFLRKKALELHTEFVLLETFKPRHQLSLLIDEWDDNDTSALELEVRRLKDLSLFYEQDNDEVEGVYMNFRVHDDAEIRSEANYQLGLIYFFRALKDDKSKSEETLFKSNDFFKIAFNSISNRTDAEFFANVTKFLLNTLNFKLEGNQRTLEQLFDIIVKRESFSLQNPLYNTGPLYIGIFRTLFALNKVANLDQESSLDFRKTLQDLHYYHAEIINIELKNRLFKSTLNKDLSNFIRSNYFEPFFALNFEGHLVKIKKYRDEITNTSEEYEFISDLIDVIESSPSKKKVEHSITETKLCEFYPHQKSYINENLQDININNPIELLTFFNSLILPTNESLMNVIVDSCIRMQSQKLYWDCSEDQRNSFISNQLQASGFVAKDQARWGDTMTGKSDGEVDILVESKSGKPLAILEALNLKGIDRTSISKHVKKIFLYDTTGFERNYILVYAATDKFHELWIQYIEYIKTVDYKYTFKDFKQDNIFDRFADLRIGHAIHRRNGKDVFLTHIFIKFPPLK